MKYKLRDLYILLLSILFLNFWAGVNHTNSSEIEDNSINRELIKKFFREKIFIF